MKPVRDGFRVIGDVYKYINGQFFDCPHTCYDAIYLLNVALDELVRERKEQEGWG